MNFLLELLKKYQYFLAGIGETPSKALGDAISKLNPLIIEEVRYFYSYSNSTNPIKDGRWEEGAVQDIEETLKEAHGAIRTVRSWLIFKLKPGVSNSIRFTSPLVEWGDRGSNSVYLIDAVGNESQGWSPSGNSQHSIDRTFSSSSEPKYIGISTMSSWSTYYDIKIEEV